jgi:hypothetical protein
LRSDDLKPFFLLGVVRGFGEEAGGMMDVVDVVDFVDPT